MLVDLLPYIPMVVEAARQHAFRTVPTEYGMFDAKARAEAFAKFLAWRGLIISIGEMDKEEVDRLVEAYDLNE